MRGVRCLAALGLLAVVAAAPPTAAPATEPVFGRTVAGSEWFAMGADYKRSSRFALSGSASVTHLAAHVDGLGATTGSQQLRFAVYADQSGQPQNLLAQTSSATISAGQAAGWLRLPLATPLSLSAGSYHLAILSGPTGNVARYSRTPASNSLRWRSDTFADGASNPYGSANSDDYQIAIHALVARPPQNLAPPEISGLARVGERLTALPGSWSEPPDTFGYEWRSCDASGANCTPIAGAEQPSYTLVPADSGRTVRVAVTATNADGAATAVSSAVGPIAAAASSTVVFGREAEGSGWFGMGADYKRSSRFTLAAAATVTDVAAHVDGLGGATGTQQLRYAVYTDESGQPQNLLAQTTSATISAGQAAGWLRLPLASPLSLPAGSYHLAILSGPTGYVARYSRSPVSNGLHSGPDTFANGASSPYGSATPDHYQIAIHALHDPAAGQPPAPPTGLTQTAASTTSVGVAWTASASQVEGYSVYADGVQAGTTSATAHTLTGLACGRTYTIGVEAFRADGSVSARASVTATTTTCPVETVTCHRVAAPSGSDGNAGTLAAPYRTAQRLADTLATGETGCLRGGSYTAGGGAYVLNASRSGFRLRSYPGERARLIGILVLRNTATAITLSHLDIEGTGSQNTLKVHAADAVIEDNTITNLGRGLSCLILGDNAGWGAATRAIVRRNTFHDCGNTANGNKDHGIYAGNSSDGQLLNNVFWRTAAYSIHLYPNAQRNRVALNIVDGASPSVRGGIIVAGDGSYTSNNNLIEQNVVAYAETANIETYWQGNVGSGNVARKNCLWAGKQANISGSGLSTVDNLVADPLFVNRSARDYRLGASSSCRSVLDAEPGP